MGSVVKAFDVVITKIAPLLDLDDFQRDAPGVAKTVQNALGDVNGFAFGEQQHLIATLHIGRPLGDHPVFAAMTRVSTPMLVTSFFVLMINELRVSRQMTLPRSTLPFVSFSET